MKTITIDERTIEVQRDDGTPCGRFTGSLSPYVFTESDGSQWKWDQYAKAWISVDQA